MKFLNNRLKFTLQNIGSHSAGTYMYQVLRGTTVIFVGNFFYNGTDVTYTFDVSDIIRSDVKVLSQQDILVSSQTIIPAGLQQTYQVRVYWTSSSTQYTNVETVNLVWVKPNENEPDDIFLVSNQSTEYTARVLLQGEEKVIHYLGYAAMQVYEEEHDVSLIYRRYPDGDGQSGYAWAFVNGSTDTPFDEIEDWFNINTSDIIYTDTLDIHMGDIYDDYEVEDYVPDVNDGKYQAKYNFLPHYPYIVDSNIPFLATLWHGSSTETYLNIDIGTTDNDYYYTEPSDSTYYYANKLSNMLVDLHVSTIAEDGKILYLDGEIDDKTQIGVLDACAKPFYLIWQDRMGSFQCQGFNGKYKYSESFERSEVKSYTDARRNSNIQVQPKWTIHTPWLKESDYTYYESIFTSPILILHDTEKNKNYPVLVTGDYTEKRYKTEKTFLNLTLDLELNEKQNIIY